MLVFLIGFMGCGKSRTGRAIQEEVGLLNVDSDKVIEEAEGMSVAEIFQQKGEDFFRQTEKEYLHSLRTSANLLVSAGGGMPCFFDNMSVMNGKGVTVFLNRPKEMVLERLLRKPHKRPLLAGMSPEELSLFMIRNWQSGCPFIPRHI